MAEVILDQVTRAFAQNLALDKISLTVPDESFVVLLGPTGAGKTTTLRMVSGLDRPDSGNVIIDGVNVNDMTPAQRNVAMVFQQYSLYPHLSVRQTLEFPLQSPLLNTPATEIGWSLLPEYWGKGYATEAGRRWLEYAFEDTELEEIVSFAVHDKYQHPGADNMPQLQTHDFTNSEAC